MKKTKSEILYKIQFEVDYKLTVFVCKFALYKNENTPFFFGDSFTPEIIYLLIPFNEIEPNDRKELKRLAQEKLNELPDFDACICISQEETEITWKILNSYIRKHLDGQDLDDFIYWYVYPYFYIKAKEEAPVKESIVFFDKYVLPLKDIEFSLMYLDKRNPMFSDESISHLLKLFEALENKNRTYINKLMKYWRYPEKQYSPERIIYNMAFGSGDGKQLNEKERIELVREDRNPQTERLDLRYFVPQKIKPLGVKEISEALRNHNCALSRQAIQQICNKMHIKRLGGKGGRPPKEKQQ